MDCDWKETEERYILVGVQQNAYEQAEESLDELEELAKTAGALVVGRLLQKREAIHPVTYRKRENTGIKRIALGTGSGWNLL